MCQKNNIIKEKKFTHITFCERTQIERWFNKEHRTKAEIAGLLGKCVKTIYNEIKRGLTKQLTSNYETIIVYCAETSERKYRYEMTSKGPQMKIGNDRKFVEYVETAIKEDKLSPEIIVAKIAQEGKEFKTKVCAKTIRNMIQKGGIFKIKPGKIIYKKVYKEKNKNQYTCSKVPAEKSIEYRPQEANERSEYGHWEGDLVIGKKTQGPVLFTLTERSTRREIIRILPGKSAMFVAMALDELEREYGARFYEEFKTITFDNGGEFRDWKALEKSCLIDGNRTAVYYAHPYRSGERGTNENTNRLIRRFIPKGIDMHGINAEFVQKIEDWINNLPRKIFGFKTPLQMLT